MSIKIMPDLRYAKTDEWVRVDGHQHVGRGLQMCIRDRFMTEDAGNVVPCAGDLARRPFLIRN